MDSSHRAETTTNTEPVAARKAAIMADQPAGVDEFEIDASATPR
jgi:hypothetical protein